MKTPTMTLHATRSIPISILLGLSLLGGCSNGGGDGPLDGSVDGSVDVGSGEGTVDPIALPSFDPPAADTILGTVINVDGQPVEGATVTLGAATATTDALGRYFLANVAPAQRLVVRFSHPGYADTTRTATMFADGRVAANVVLVRRQAPVVVDPAAGGELTVPGGGVVKLPAAGVVDATGAVATGEVRLQVSPISVQGSAIQAAPGDFSAVTAAGEDGQLETFAMAEYRLLDGDGKSLQLAEGKQATIELLLPADTQLTAGEVVPAWHFDEAQGRWIEQGTGTVQPASQDPQRLAFVAEVPHFSTWNCDKTFEITCLSGRVLHCDGTPAPGADLLGQGTSYDGTSSAFGGADGSFCIQVRRNSTVQLAAAEGFGAERLVAMTTVTTPDTNVQCPGPCMQVDLTLPCTPQESEVDCDDTYFAGCRACVSGRVVDKQGQPVAAVLKVTSGHSTLTAVTDAHGRYCAPAGLDALATIVATARSGESGMVTVTPSVPGACPSCTAAPELVVDVSSNPDDELDFSQCPADVGGMTIERVTSAGSATAFAGLEAGWLLATRMEQGGEGKVLWDLGFHFVSPQSRGTTGAPVAFASLSLLEAPTAAVTYTLDSSSEQVAFSGQALSLSGGMTGLSNETYDLDDSSGLARAEIRLDGGFSKVGDRLTGSYSFTFGPQCALPGSTVTFSGRIDTVLRQAQGMMPSVMDVNAPEFKAWLCGMYDLLTWAQTLASGWQGAIQLQLDGAPLPSGDSPLVDAHYSWLDDRFTLSDYGDAATVSITAEHPVAGATPLTAGTLTLNSSDCYYQLASGTLFLADFDGGTADTWFTGSFEATFTKSPYVEGNCPDRQVSGEFGAAVCR